jgi:hypothetical protein
VLYAWLYPNLMINRYGPMMDTNWVIPHGHDETEVIFDYYFTPETASDAEFVEKSLAASDVVQQEDVDICESVQKGTGVVVVRPWALLRQARAGRASLPSPAGRGLQGRVLTLLYRG